ncbi:anti-sigma factor [Mesorhizobium sp. SB112]|uniref:anti-sigma factor n=1 Tax=Mesorhizobium sp. SB112 TaxID=3151853 RepID=UPI00326335B1
MSFADENLPERGDGDMIAAEYVLGVLPADERKAASARVETDQDFARQVDAWTVHLSPLNDGYAPVEAPASVKQAIDARLFSSSAKTTESKAGLWLSLAFWRGLATAAVAALAIYIAVPYVSPPATTPPMRMVASLAADNSDVRYLAMYDEARGEVSLSHVSGERESGKDFELWMIEGDNAPVSMGVIPAGASVHMKMEMDEAARQKLAGGAVLAVSLEPQGGSPTGQPTGPVVAAGDLRNI